MPSRMPGTIDAFRRNLDLVLVLAILGIVLAVFIKMPTGIIDVLLVFNIALAVTVLITSIYVREPLQFSVFPSLLLMTTAYRLALNVATTRLILSNAGEQGPLAAGKVILAFGDFVAGNQAFVGFVIFVIIVIVQFIVITKGANRVSEVAARFTLDAMPGRQMSIDADLNAGLIDENQARHRREQINRQADFYGAMDGATKFVRGDAIAGIIITLVNIVGGLVIGMVQDGRPFGEAVEIYTKLTVGDGLVSQIPALIISISAGLIVTRTTSESDLGRDLMTQIFSAPRALLVTAGFLLILAVTPLPTIPLLGTAAGVIFIAHMLRQTAQDTVQRETEAKRKEEARQPEKVEGLLRVDPMELEIGYGLIRLVDASKGGDLMDRIAMIRRQTALDSGLIVPPIRIRDNMQLEPQQYTIKIRGIRVAEGKALVDHCMALDAGTAAGGLEGEKTTDPAFGLPAVWIPEAEKQRAEALGYTVVDTTTVVATHLTEVIKRHAAEILTRDDVNHLLDQLKQTSQALVDEVVPGLLKPGEVQKVLQRLLAEGVSIRDLRTILETLGDWAPRSKDSLVLTEYVRHALGRGICQQYVERNGRLYVVTLDPQAEDLLRNAIETTKSGETRFALSPDVLERLRLALLKDAERLVAGGHAPVLLCAPEIRPHVRRIVDGGVSPPVVFSYAEIPSDVTVESIGMVTLQMGTSAA